MAHSLKDQGFYQLIHPELNQVNAFLEERLSSNVPLIQQVGDYIVSAGGKRLRPIVVLLSSLANGYQGQDHIHLAGCIEFIHTATLLHDDVVDNSSLRRARLTANAQWGNAAAVLVGDFLYSRVFQIMVAMKRMDTMQVIAVATNIIAEGEVLQLTNLRNVNISEAQYRQVIYAKTGILFEAAAKVGAVLAKADANTIATLTQFGAHLGTAFQLIDDALDYQGDIDTLGKNIGDDLAEGKPTLPLIYLLNHGDAKAQQVVKKALTEETGEHLEDIIHLVRTSEALTYTLNQAEAESHKALACIQHLPESNYRKALIELTEFAVLRRF